MIDRLFSANSIAFIGATPRSALLAGMADRLKIDGFPGKLWMINPNRPDVFGVEAFPSLKALPAVPDLAVIAVRAGNVSDVLVEAAHAGVGATIVVSTGFADAGATGAALLTDVQRTASEHGIVMCGPGSFGFAVPHRRLTPFCGGNTDVLPAGNISVVAQSGGFANILALAAGERGFGFSYLIATGSEGTLTAADFLAHVVEDERTDVVVAVLEEIRDVPTIRAALRRAAVLNKPVVVFPLGRSEAGQRATSAHSGALATRADIQDAFLRELGAMVVTTVDDLIETAMLAASWRGREPQTPRPLIVTISGGDCSLVLDLASDLGMTAPELPASIQHVLHELIADSTMLFNPLDIGTRPLTELDLAAKIIETGAAAPSVNLVMTRLFGTADDFRNVAEAAARTGKPHLAFTRAALQIEPAMLEVSRQTSTPILQSTDRALAAVARVAAAAPRRKWLANLETVEASASCQPLSAETFAKPMAEADALEILNAAGVPTVPLRRVTSMEEAVMAARELGYPLAVKVDSPDVEHKSDIGGVRLNVGNDDDLRRAMNEIAVNVRAAMPDAHVRGIVLQPMLRPQLELIAGCVPDDRFGTAVFVGFGGLLAEMLGRPQLRMVPLDEAEAALAVERLLSPAGKPANFRKLDIAGAGRAFMRFSQFAAEAAPFLSAIEVNPLGVFADGGGAVALDALLIPRC